MSVSPGSPGQSTNPFSHLLNSISSYDGNVMLAAVISLLLVILFVLLLHVYAKWFLIQARQRSSSSSLSSVSHVFRHDRFHHFHALTFDANFPSFPSKGLDSSVISSIPLFVYRIEEHKHGNLECVICLSPFEDNDVGRRLPKCGHGFHVECIDMWLHSHSNCPICRSSVLLMSNDKGSVLTSADGSEATSLELGSVDEMGMIDVSDSNNTQIGAASDDSLSASSSSSSSLTLSSSLACSLKRMLSRNRSERKVFPSSNATEPEV